MKSASNVASAGHGSCFQHLLIASRPELQNIAIYTLHSAANETLNSISVSKWWVTYASGWALTSHIITSQGKTPAIGSRAGIFSISATRLAFLVIILGVILELSAVACT
jgi:hypothetical protein